MTAALLALVLAGVGAVTAVIVIGGGALWTWSDRRGREQRQAWEREAPALGLAAVPPGNDALVDLRGEREGFDVRLSLLPFTSPGMESVVRVRVGGSGRWPSTVIFEPPHQGLASADGDGRLLERMPTGLEDFDDAILALGPPQDVLATLDPAAREQLRATALRSAAVQGLYRDTWRVDGGVIEWHRRLPERDPVPMSHVVDGLLALARALDRRGRSVAQCLADNARDDMPPLRVRHLAALVESFAGSAIAIAACRRALDDEDPPTRLVAAVALGRDHATQLAALARDEAIEESIRVEALTAWAGLTPTAEDARPLLEGLLATRHAGLRVAAIRAAGRLHCAEVLPSLVELTRDAADDEACQLAITLRLIDDPTAEDAVAQLLGSGGEGTQVEIVRALSAIGSVASVEPLQPLATGLAVPRAVKRAAREALRAIRSRLGPVDAGRLSVFHVDDDAGDLSIADDAEGRVSLERRDEREGEK